MIKKRQLLNKIDILKNISTEHKESLKELTIFEEIGSTNNEAKRKLEEIENFNDSLAILSEKQTSGRGRSGKTWESPANVNVYLSFGWRSSLMPSDLEGLSLARTQKEEFASVIESNNGDVTKLFDTLKEFVAK